MQAKQIPEKNISNFVQTIKANGTGWIAYNTVWMDENKKAFVNLDGYFMSRKSDEFPLKIKRMEEGFIIYLSNHTNEWQYSGDLDDDVSYEKSMPVVAFDDKEYTKNKKMCVLEYKKQTTERSSPKEKITENMEIAETIRRLAEQYGLYEVAATAKDTVRKILEELQELQEMKKLEESKK
ncbi:MAG: hypothetical protein M3P22_01275 [bacterium]|nr:hypothetical protein [bacterium]